jgi:SAM-dependent methyltransferase
MDEYRTADYMRITQAFYDTHAQEYVANTRGMTDVSWLEYFTGLLPPAAKVLDLGCAGGRDCSWFVDRGFTVFGVDSSPEMVRIAQAEVPRANISLMNLLQLDYPPELFDGVWCSCVLLHISKADTAEALLQIARVLKPAGVVYILVKEGGREGYESDGRYRGDQKFSSSFAFDELGGMIANAGFNVIESSGLHKQVDEYRAKDRLFFVARKR